MQTYTHWDAWISGANVCFSEGAQAGNPTKGGLRTKGRARSLLLEAARGLQGSQLVEEWLWLALSVVEEPLSTGEPGHGRCPCGRQSRSM
jgi:hypothetical protein